MGACPPPRRSWKLALVMAGTLPLDPPDPLFCPPVANSWLRPCNPSKYKRYVTVMVH